MSDATLPRPRHEIRTIVMLEPRPPDLHIFSRFALPRVGATLLATILRDRGYDVRVMVEEVAPFDWEAVARADLVGISTITSTAGRANTIARELRAAGIPVVMGGPHPTHVSEDSLQHCDYVIRGEGEAAFPALIEALETGGDLSRVDNLSYRDADGAIRHNAMAPLDPDLDQWPDPDWSLVDRFHGAVGNMVGPKRVVPIQTSRGCPYDCAFCSVTTTFGRKMRYRSVERVIAEMQRQDLANTLFFFYDDNFAASPRRTWEMVEAISALPEKTVWTAQVRADVARDIPLLDAMAASGAGAFYIGLESVNQESLRSQLKRQDLDQVAVHLDRIVDRGIDVHGMFVFGFDTDSFDTPERTLAFARKHRINTVQFLILTPLPGSRTYEQLKAEGRLLFHDWSLYDAHHVCFRPRAVTPRELQRWQLWGHEHFYDAKMIASSLWNRRWVRGAVGIYARNLQRNWIKANGAYLEALERLSAPRLDEAEVPFRREYPELHTAIARAVQATG